ncbi:MAG TPA: hypothetical protein VHQ87_01310 [Rhizobacter sp.]|jgi:acyl-CoA hydrolase|nr:hypothetical protein [Rhizobacter sp.]
MSGHFEDVTYAEPEELYGGWVIAELDAAGAVVAEFGYATEAAARSAYADLIKPKGEA